FQLPWSVKKLKTPWLLAVYVTELPTFIFCGIKIQAATSRNTTDNKRPVNTFFIVTIQMTGKNNDREITIVTAIVCSQMVKKSKQNLQFNRYFQSVYIFPLIAYVI